MRRRYWTYCHNSIIKRKYRRGNLQGFTSLFERGAFPLSVRGKTSKKVFNLLEKESKFYRLKEHDCQVEILTRNKEVIDYTTGKVYQGVEGSIVMSGVLYQRYIVSLEYLAQNYLRLRHNESQVPSFSDIGVMDMGVGTRFTVKSKPNHSLVYGALLPYPERLTVCRSDGECFVTHSSMLPARGDYVLCSEDNSSLTDPKPRLSDLWMVNGNVFPLMYEEVL